MTQYKNAVNAGIFHFGDHDGDPENLRKYVENYVQDGYVYFGEHINEGHTPIGTKDGCCVKIIQGKSIMLS